MKAAFAAVAIAGVATPSLAAGPSRTADLVQPVLIQEVVKDSGAARISLSGRLRMLSQRLVSSACHSAAGIVPEMSAPMLAIASDEFDRILSALRFGNAKLSVMSPESDLKVRAQIDAVRAVWDPMHEKVRNAAGKAVSIDLADELSGQAIVLLDETNQLYNQASSAYGNPALMLQPDAMLVDISGRQRILAQQISKNTCLASEGDASVLAELADNIEVYDTSLQALRNGMAEVGILPPPTQEIADILDEALVEWSTMQPILARVMAGEQLTAEEREVIFIGGYSLSAKMNFLAWKYGQRVKANS